MNYIDSEDLDIVYIDAKLITETEQAYLLENDNEEEIWVPKSKVKHCGDNVFAMPEYLAKDKEFI